MVARRLVFLALSVAAVSVPSLYSLVSSDELHLLQDSDGWEYTKIVTASGFPTEHPCFDGTPHPQECRGTLTLGSDERFVKKIYIKGQTDTRTGRYKISGGELTFFDEYDTQDGPYKMTLDSREKTLALELGSERIYLMLAKEYRSRNKSQNKPKQ
ncbi:MAG: hypothetical protein ACJ746_18030 [Bryobacteraceae bacterium]